VSAVGIIVREWDGTAIGRVDADTAARLVAAGAEYAGQRRRRYIRLPRGTRVPIRAVGLLWQRIERTLKLYGPAGLRALDHAALTRERPAALPGPPSDEVRHEQAIQRFVRWLPEKRRTS
jgi:hypothetical protein